MGKRVVSLELLIYNVHMHTIYVLVPYLLQKFMIGLLPAPNLRIKLRGLRSCHLGVGVASHVHSSAS